MERGMLWFDNDPKTDVVTKIKQAAAYYRRKYGQTPNLCFVNPAAITRETVTEEKIKVRPYRIVLPGHFWIGISEGPAAS